MRDIILLAALLSILPLIFRAPVIGVLAWIWVALMNPQREVFGFLSVAPLNYAIAVVTLGAWLFSRERKYSPLNPFTVLLVLFGFWISVTTYFALAPEHSQPLWERTIKTILLVIAIPAIATTKVRLQAVVWTVAISLGYFAVKGGAFVLVTGGHYRVLGPADSMIEDNNCLGLALVMLMPLLYYLGQTSKLKAVTMGCYAAMGLTALAIIGTYSRGALVAIAAMGLAFVVKRRVGVIPLALCALLVTGLPYVVPEAWFDRMTTITAANKDESFGERLEAWKTSTNLADARPFTGGGFSATELDWIAANYETPGSLPIGRAAHSIYFQVLGDHGYVGLALYLALIASAFYNTVSVGAMARKRPELRWAARLADMIQISMVGYLVGGAALSMAYYDGFLVLLAVTAALNVIVRKPAEQPSYRRTPTFVPRWAASASRQAAVAQATVDSGPMPAGVDGAKV
ncbi:MAG TPA: putative O-glycosylation ligase, exosortase A system-associated [Rhizomicrobium sp.]|nr:putative O-glycosylation ligase, exosortase A system-associated [Rhizomicrobium sp.]